MKALALVVLVLALIALLAVQIWLGRRGRTLRDQRAAEDEAYDQETGRDRLKP